MKKLFLAAVVLLTVAATSAFGQDSKIVQHLQDISVTVRASNSQGSGTLVTRKVGDKTVSFVWTAGHVVDGLRQTREIIDSSSGGKKTIIEFNDAGVVQEFRQDGRRVGETQLDAQVIRYSDADSGEDLALLRIRKANFAPVEISAKFYLDKDIPALGTKLYHVGSLLGQFGANSLTTGVISQHGRVFNLNGANGVVFDQTTASAFPGSSGGGVFRESDAAYIGCLVRGASETFNFVVPVRRMHAWAKKANVEWAMDPSVAMPSEEELDKLPIEDSGFKSKSNDKTPDAKAYPTLIAYPGLD